MQCQDWQRVKELFQAGMDLPTEVQATYIRANSHDAEIAERVLRLLGHHQVSERFLQPLDSPLLIDSTSAGPSKGDQPIADPMIGRQLGNFCITRRLGAGGTSVIYEALQDSPTRKAAIKVLRMDMGTSGMLQRLAEEARILAKMQHPGIAQVIAAGQADFGLGLQPWFAMEYVDGLNLTEYVKAHPLPLKKVLALVLQIAEAVEHAHQRGILHRDLKPANILVACASSAEPGPTQPQIKILDFGVARSMVADRESSPLTLVGDLIGTLDYMCPEQFACDPELLAARCDVFALGTIGFELLTGHLPHDRRSQSLSTIAQQVRHVESRRLAQFNPNLQGDLDVVFAKALAIDPETRYQSVADFAMDIRRFLASEPVMARKPTNWYRFRKFSQRNQILVGGVASTVFALMLGLVLYAQEAGRARAAAESAQKAAAESQYEAEKAMAINNFMTNDFMMTVLNAAHSTKTAERLPIVQMVRDSAANITAMFSGKPLIEAAIRNEIGTVYYNLSEFEAAANEFNTSLQLWGMNLSEEHPDTLKAQSNLALTLFRQNKWVEAEELFRQALAGRERVLGPEDPMTLMTMNNLAELLRATKRPEEAEAMLRQTLNGQIKVLGERHKDTLATMANLGSMLSQQGQLNEALEMHRRVYDLSCRTLGANHVTTMQAGAVLGLTLHKNKLNDEALDLLTVVLDNQAKTYGPDHQNTIITRRTLARALRELGKSKDARQQLAQALEIAKSQSPPLAGAIKAIERELAGLSE